MPARSRGSGSRPPAGPQEQRSGALKTGASPDVVLPPARLSPLSDPPIVRMGKGLHALRKQFCPRRQTCLEPGL